MSDEVAPPLRRATLIRRITQSLVTRLAEIGLAVIGIAYINSPDTADAESSYLGYVNLLVLTYLYFAITLGISFAVSDVDTIRRDTRWHVLVHSVISFFYNSAVLAVAVGVVTQK